MEKRTGDSEFINFKKKAWLKSVPERDLQKSEQLFDEYISEFHKLKGDESVSFVLDPLKDTEADAILTAFELFQDLRGKVPEERNYLRESWQTVRHVGKKYYVKISLDGSVTYPEGV